MLEWQGRIEGSLPEPPYPMPGLIWQILYSRGVKDVSSIQNFLSPKLKDISNPFKILNLDIAVERIIEAYKNNEKIAIYADFDLDGTSGLALMVDGLKKLGFSNLIYYQPKRLSEGYGLHGNAIEDLAQQQVKVIITVDVGITAVDAADVAKNNSIDLIITDHHLPGEVLPKAFTIVNPNQKEDNSGMGYLCGAGVAFYLLVGIKTEMSRQGLLKQDFNLKDVLDLFVIGTLTDMVPLVKDNRVLIKHGLLKISQAERPGLKLLLKELGMFNRPLSSQDVAIGLAPKLNALSRIESHLLPRDVLLVENELEAQGMVKEILKTQELRKKYQNFAIEKAYELKEMMDQAGYIWLWSHEFHKGVIGLVATHMTQKFNVPCFIGSVNEQGKVTASSRIPEGSEYDLTQILKACSAALEKFGGHMQAAGFQLDLTRAGELDDLFQEYFEENKSQTVFKEVFYDAVGEIKDLNPTFMKWFDSLEPFGKDFPSVNILFKNVYIYKIKNLNGGHLKLTFKQESINVSGLLFSPEEKHRGLKDFDFVDVVAQPQWNYFNGSKEIQLLIKAIKKVSGI